ncbi:MAG TPA: hypothetical protein VMW08_17670 [Acidimicrobiales bacterium]|nr:hypothetical protein [Acidimicrobiales bacterium]
MSDQDPLEPTRVDTDAVGEPTMMQPAAGEPPPPTDPPPGGPPPGGPPPGDDGDDGGANRDRNMKIAIGATVALILILLGILLFTGDDDASVDSADPTTSSTSSTSTSTTTTEATTTTTQPPTTSGSTTSTTQDTTPPLSTCSGKDAPPDDASPIAKTFMDSWQLDDRPCAEAVATQSAVDTMFAVEPGPTPQDFFGCSPVDDGAGDPHIDCVFGFEGGTTHLKMNFGAVDGWRVFEVFFVAD